MEEALTKALIGEPDLTAREVAERAGLPLEEAQRLWRALGLPPVDFEAKAFTRADLETLQVVAELRRERPLPEAVTIRLARVIGQSMARIAEAQVTTTDLPEGALDAPAILSRLESLLGFAWRRHLLAAVRRANATNEDVSGARELVVGFADIVGFTALSQQLDDEELTRAIDRFETIVEDSLHEHEGHLIKMIGDEAMFSAIHPAGAAAIALSLLEAVERDETLPALRMGMAYGPVLLHEGDLFGSTVNLASRLVNLAHPGSVLISEPLAEALKPMPNVVTVSLRPLRLKGIGRTSPFVLRHRDAASTSEQPPSSRGRRKKKD